MKTKSILALTLMMIACMAFHPVFSQKPEKVWSFVKVEKTLDWYITQTALWKQVIDKDPKNADAWLNFYTANRMARLVDRDTWRKQKGPGFMELDEIVTKMKEAVPGTYEYYDVKNYNDGYQDQGNAEDLLKAYALAPDRTSDKRR